MKTLPECECFQREEFREARQKWIDEAVPSMARSTRDVAYNHGDMCGMGAAYLFGVLMAEACYAVQEDGPEIMIPRTEPPTWELAREVLDQMYLFAKERIEEKIQSGTKGTVQ